MINFQRLDFVQEHFEADLFLSDFHFSRVLLFANFAGGYFDYLSVFHFFGDPVEDAIFVNEGDAAGALAEGDEGEGGFKADSASSLFAFRVELNLAAIEVHQLIYYAVRQLK